MTDKIIPDRREFLRIRLSLPVEFIHISRDGSVPEGEWTRSSMVEIGGGGARLEAHSLIEEGDVLCLRFAIPDTLEEIRAYARVVSRCEGGKEVCIKFVELSEVQRGKILRYAFREQIRRRKGSEETSNPIKQELEDEDGAHN